MDGEAVRLIQESAKQEHFEVERDGHLFTDRSLSPIFHDPHPDPVKVTTLTAIRDYLSSNVDKLNVEDVLLHVESERKVSLLSKLCGPHKARDLYVVSEIEQCSFRFGDFMEPELFVIGLQTQFFQDETVASLLKVVGNIQDGAARTIVDDGVTQTVSSKVGVQVAMVQLPSSILLAPWRTFREIGWQPASAFILRARAGSESSQPKLGLFPADGNRWRLEAISGVADWLRGKIPGVTVVA